MKPKYLKQLNLWSERGVSFDYIVDHLSERSEDECYSAYHWLENAAAKAGIPNIFPEIAFVPGKHTESKRVLAFMTFPDGTPPSMMELAALGVEFLARESKRKSP